MSAIVVENLGKRFRQYQDRGSLLSRVRAGERGRRIQDIWALQDVNFTVEEGSTLGVIGRNGSGKTTLLRLLSGVSGPTDGRLRIEGRIAPLIGIGVGFNRELTGRENVLVNGRLLGMSAAEVADKFDRIVAFAELDEFIDLPVKFYSSGMFLRLAFSVAIHTEPEILLVDEILAVGDVGFQTKSFERMRSLQDRGTTVVVVTHNLQVLQRLTNRTIVLERGRIEFDGHTEEALEVYHEVIRRGSARDDEMPRPPGGLAYTNSGIVEATIESADGTSTSQVRLRHPMTICVRARFTEEVVDPIVSVVLERPGLGLLFATANESRGPDHVYGPDRPLVARVRLEDVPLLPQTYAVRVQLRSPRHDAIHAMSPTTLFHVTGDRPGAGTVDVGPSMEIDDQPVAVVRPRLGPTSDHASVQAGKE